MANFIGILQAEWGGAQAFSSFDTYLAPYVFFDMYYSGLTYKDIKKAILNFIYNLNVPSRWGQSPFSNITIDWIVPNDMSAQYPLRNDKNYFKTIYEDLSDEEKTKFRTTVIEELKKRLENIENSIDSLFDKITYKLFQKEMNLINKAFYECLNEGDINGLPFTFPIPTVNITENFDWDGENTDLLFENAAKYGSSYFQNFIGSQYKRDENGNLVPDPNAYSPNDVRSMCPLTGDTEVLTLSNRGISKTQIVH